MIDILNQILQLIHPYIIDTSIIFNLTGYRTWKSKLSLLCETFLNRHIQKSLDGHNPIEDAIAAMELVVLKLQEGLLFGDAILTRGVGQKWEEPDTVLKAITRQVNSIYSPLTLDGRYLLFVTILV